jgi:hypothetical protein
MMGLTRFESKRLRAMDRFASSLPSNCHGVRPDFTDSDFERWKADLVSYDGPRGREALQGLVSRKNLSPPLLSDLDHLRFSPDGSLVLAQDEGNLFVLRREGLSLVFRVDAAGASPARFARDSGSIFFESPGLRVHHLMLDGAGKMVGSDVAEIFRTEPCSSTALSPSGDVVACQGYDGELVLYDVATGEPIHTEKNFLETLGLVLSANVMSLVLQQAPSMEFTPDGRYFVAAFFGPDFGAYRRVARRAPVSRTHYFAFDLQQKREIKLPDEIRDRVARGFVFPDDGHMIGIHIRQPEKSGLLTFPEGALLSEFPVRRQSLSLPARGNYLFVSPIRKAALGVMDLSTGKLFLASDNPAFDMYDSLTVSQAPSGEIELADTGKSMPVVRVELPVSALAGLRTAVTSRDSRWLAVSGSHRGAVFDTATGERVFETRGFQAGWFDETGRLYADFADTGNAERRVWILETANGKQHEGISPAGDSEIQVGGFLLSSTNDEDGNQTITARSIRSGADLWRMKFKDGWRSVYPVATTNTLAFLESGLGDEARSIIDEDGVLSRERAALETGSERLLRLFELSTGKRLGQLVSGGGFPIANVLGAGKQLILSDGANRVLVYSLEDGKRVGALFGADPIVSPTAGLFAVLESARELALYRLDGGSGPKRLRGLVFPQAVVHMSFSNDGARLVVLTADQKVFLLDPMGD